MHNLVSLSGVLRSLQEADIPFVVMGGQAVGAKGASEGSRDLDIYLAAPELLATSPTSPTSPTFSRTPWLGRIATPERERLSAELLIHFSDMRC